MTADVHPAPRKAMNKGELIRHLNGEHGQSDRNVIIPHRWTMAALKDLHRIIHLGLGR
jgi:hypothetical protein